MSVYALPLPLLLLPGGLEAPFDKASSDWNMDLHPEKSMHYEYEHGSSRNFKLD
jgi:hypothetical protein